MTPDEIRQIVREELAQAFLKPDRFVIDRTMQFLDGRKIIAGRNKGLTIGSTVSDKLGFYGVTPIAQQAAITRPVLGSTIDSQARSAINTIITNGSNLGFWVAN